jgi:OmpA family/Carboxypeptidase regulatory-like domain
LPSLTGPVGLLHASTAEVGPLHQLRFGLHGEYFGANSFLISGDANQRLNGGLAVGYTLLRDLELFGAILNSSNRNRRPRGVNDRDPELIKTFGDLVVGGKWILSLSPAATLGVELGLKFLSGVTDLAVSPSSTSWWLGPLFSYDLRRDAQIPLRLHAGASFYGDNSSNLHDLAGVTRETKEVTMFGYGIASSRLRLALAADAPLDKLIPGVPVDPFIEYHLAYVTSDADSDFQDYLTPNCDSSNPAKMPCIENRDIQWLTLGARADVYRGITVDLGVDIRIRSAGFPYGAPVPPYNVMFGVSYPLDLDSLTRTVVVTKTVQKPAAPTEGQVTGVVLNAQDNTPIGGAMVAVTGRAHARAGSDSDGGFQTIALPKGSVELEVTAANFESAKMATTVLAGKAVDVTIALTPIPVAAKVHGRVSGVGGKGVEASVRFAGKEIHEARSDASGSFTLSLPVGSYRVLADSPGLIPKEAEVELLVGQDKQLDFVLRPATANPTIALAADSIKIKKPIRFVGLTPAPTAETQKTLDAVADLLALHPEIKRIRIVAHWDNGMEKAQAAMLTEQQAEAVRAYLVGRGIAEARLVAAGAGSTQPSVPNLGPMNRARNRRVEFLRE